MHRRLETTQKVGIHRPNLSHSVHRVRTNHSNNWCAWGMQRQDMQHPVCLSQCRHGIGRENGNMWEVNGNNGKYFAPNIQTARDIWEGNASPLCFNLLESTPDIISLIRLSHKWTRIIFILSNSKLGIWICIQPIMDINSQSNVYDVLTLDHTSTCQTQSTKQHKRNTFYI